MRPSIFPSALRAVTTALALSLPVGARAEAPAGPVLVIDGFAHPESVLIAGDRRFVSNIGAALDPLAKDGDGFISEVSADGRILATRAFPPAGETLDAPKGMATAGGRLYVADIDRVIGFDLASGVRVFEQRIPGAQPFANDLAVAADGTLLVSDTLQNAVYRINPATGEVTQLAAGIPGANGIAVDPRNQRILVAGLGEAFGGGDIFAVGAGGAVQRLENGPHGLFDGLAVRVDGRILVSDWRAIDHPVPGALMLMAPDGTVAGEVPLGREIHGPADFALDEANGLLWIPATVDNQLVVVQLAP